METADKLGVAIVTAAFAIIFAVIIAFSVWAWQNAADKRDCRRRGVVVADLIPTNEWHCVGATPEGK